MEAKADKTNVRILFNVRIKHLLIHCKSPTLHLMLLTRGTKNYSLSSVKNRLTEQFVIINQIFTSLLFLILRQQQ